MLPPVYSTTSWPGRRRPSASAASIIASAIRSLYEPVGLAASIFTQTSAHPSPAIRRVKLRGVDVMEVADGLIQHNTIYYDGASLARQIGMLPFQGSRADRALVFVFNSKSRLSRRRR